MDDKLRDIFDSLDPEEVDELLKDIDISDVNAKDSANNISKISENRIRRQVLKKTGVRSVPNRRRIYAIAASAAVFFISVGIIGYVEFGPGAKKSDDRVSDYAEGSVAEYVADSEQELGDSMDYAAEAPAAAEEKVAERSESNGVGVGSKGVADSMAKADTAVAAVDSMASEEVELMLSESAYEIDKFDFSGAFSELSDMENDCDYVVVGVKTESIFVQTEDENVYSLEAGFRVEKVITDNTGEGIPDNIMVDEGITYEPDRDVYVRDGGYSYMKTGNEYVLFLKKSGEGKYRIDGVVYGKIPVDESETGYSLAELGSDEDMSAVKSVIKDAWNEYVAGTHTSVKTQPDGGEPQSVPEATQAPAETDISGSNEPDMTAEPTAEPNNEITEH